MKVLRVGFAPLFLLASSAATDDGRYASIINDDLSLHHLASQRPYLRRLPPGSCKCRGQETCETCPSDCGACPVCGDGTCDAGQEDCLSCPNDCGPCSSCGDGTCDTEEDCATCPNDCGQCPCGDELTFRTCLDDPSQTCNFDADCDVVLGTCNSRSDNEGAGCETDGDCPPKKGKCEGAVSPTCMEYTCNPSADPLPFPDGYSTEITFVAMGDIPYNEDERFCLQSQLRDISGDPLVFHVGDIKRGATDCSEDAYDDIAEIFNSTINELGYKKEDCFFVIGDNEWNDCGSCDDNTCPTPPEDGLLYWMTHFGPNNPSYFGTLSNAYQTVVSRQSAREENFAFQANGVTFIGLNVVGSTSIDNQAERMQQNFDWVQQKMAETSETMEVVVIVGHAYPFTSGTKGQYLGAPLMNLLRDTYPNLPVMYIYGDGHNFCVRYPDSCNSNLVAVEVDGRGTAPPLQVSVLSDIAGNYAFSVDRQGGPYAETGCPASDDQTWT